MMNAARHIEQIKVSIWCNTIVVCETHVDVEAEHLSAALMSANRSSYINVI